MKALPKALPKAYRVGEHVTALHYSDRSAYEVVGQSPNGGRLLIRRLKATLLNPVGSGAPDALHFAPGGFCGHTSGTQRYAYESNPSAKVERANWSAKRGAYYIGTSRIVDGASEEYDFNF